MPMLTHRMHAMQGAPTARFHLKARTAINLKAGSTLQQRRPTRHSRKAVSCAWQLVHREYAGGKRGGGGGCGGRSADLLGRRKLGGEGRGGGGALHVNAAHSRPRQPWSANSALPCPAVVNVPAGVRSPLVLTGATRHSRRPHAARLTLVPQWAAPTVLQIRPGANARHCHLTMTAD